MNLQYSSLLAIGTTTSKSRKYCVGTEVTTVFPFLAFNYISLHSILLCRYERYQQMGRLRQSRIHRCLRYAIAEILITIDT